MSAEPLEDDAALLQRWGEGDTLAGDALIRRHFDALHRYLRSRVSEHEVEELVQDALLACLEARHRYRAEASFRTFLIAIARYLLWSRQRSRRALSPMPEDLLDSATSQTQRLVKGQNVARLSRAVADLQEPLRTVLELVYWQGLDVPSVARQLGLPLNTAYSHLHRARVALRALLHEETERPAS